MKKFKNLIEERKKSKPSSGERIVMQFLRKKRIKFKREYYHPDLINDETGCPLFFDFYIRSLNLVIEVDGVHHFKPINGKTREFNSQVHKDNIKNRFCVESNIKMLRLTYSDLKPPMSKLTGTFGGISGKMKIKERKEHFEEQQVKLKTKKKKKCIKYVKTKSFHPERNMSKLKKFIEDKETEAAKKRDEGRLRYPTDVRIYLAEKNTNYAESQELRTT